MSESNNYFSVRKLPIWDFKIATNWPNLGFFLNAKFLTNFLRKLVLHKIFLFRRNAKVPACVVLNQHRTSSVLCPTVISINKHLQKRWRPFQLCHKRWHSGGLSLVSTSSWQVIFCRACISLDKAGIVLHKCPQSFRFQHFCPHY